MKIVFFGTPQTAVPFLEYLTSKEKVLAVVTRPDSPSGRGMELKSSPIKLLANFKNITVLQPSNLKDPKFIQCLKDLDADIGFVVAYGRLLPAELITIFPKGLYNLHFSLLPRWRGASPMQWAILNGDMKSGVTTFKISPLLDSGEIFVQKEMSMASDETVTTLEEKLIPLGITAIEETLDLVRKGTLHGLSQGDSPTSYARLLKKEDAKICWDVSATDIERKVRAFIAHGAYTHMAQDKILKMFHTQVIESEISSSQAVGTVIKIERGVGFVIKCKEGNLLVLEVQPEGKKRMDAWSFLQGYKINTGYRFS